MTFYGDPTMKYALGQIKGMKTHAERRKWLDSYFGFDDDARRAVRCLSCHDTGLAMIYHPAVIVAAARGADDILWHRQIAVVCDCAAAARVASETKRGNRIPVLGDKAWHIAVNRPDSRAEASQFNLESVHDWRPNGTRWEP